ncbi:uncharacterized protein FMAN_09506 [Fusarium mangiferae]|uniref:EF-hand domain-containing protein n=1 Tax=Fusarium mangiferae TaxID=192010 RepID=A0A1L7T9A7_FUSMA|nr:uncharacterized protein FMAN_09506 [Fusarium mangiferae]CVK91376.1 uncharacterized protein FMAN_09506 [Fusarium mangiferae]
MDESNFRISGETANKKRHRVPRNERLIWRYDIRMLKGIIRKNSGITVNERVFFNVYGSNFQNLGPLYRDLKLYTSEVFNLPRNKQNQEKQVDTSLVKDMTDTVTKYSEKKTPAVFAVISGDSDMIPAVKHAASHGYVVHVWSWEKSTSRDYRRLQRNSKRRGLITLAYFDEFLASLTLRNTRIFLKGTFIPRDGIVFVDPQDHKIDVAKRAGKLNAGNVIFTRRLDEEYHLRTDIVLVPKRDPPLQDKVLRFVLQSLDEDGRQAISFAEYFYSVKLLGLDDP